MSDVLFVHNNFPAQFGFIAQALRQRGHRCVAVASKTGRALEGIELVRWRATRSTTPNLLRAAVRAEADLIRGGAAAEAALHLRQGGFSPALIIGHPGWGETTYLREIFPNASQVLYAEYYYRSEGGDVGFDAEFAPTPATAPHELYAKNAGLALALAEADAIVTPTMYQKHRLPPMFQASTRVIHEGVDTASVRRRPGARLSFADGRILDASTPVITFINRRLEPLRGLHIFLRALPRLMEAVPEAEVVIIGADERGGYGTPVTGAPTWGQKLLGEVGDRLDRRRLHMVGRVPHETMLDALSIAAAHVYYTYPFVLSWSLLEAMACECLIIASDTTPVRDAVTNAHDALLLDFFDVEALAEAMIAACREPARFSSLGKAARGTVVSRFDRATICEPAWLDLVLPMLNGR